MRLNDPWVLGLLLLVPLVVSLRRTAPDAALRYPVLGALIGAAGPGLRGRTKWRWAIPALRLGAAICLIGALARPQGGIAASRVVAEGIDIMLAVDVSSSMLAEDFTLDGKRANRLAAVKAVVADFISGRGGGDRVGLVLFAARPYTQCPLTLDHGWLQTNLERAEIGMIEDGTAVGSALAAAVGRLEASDAKSKIVILLTDGQNNAGKVGPLTAAEAATALGYRVYTIGAGTRGLAPFPARDIFGNRVYQPMPVDIDETALRKIAEETGGRYFRATDTESLEDIYAEIDTLEKSPHAGLHYREYRELYPWLLIPAVVFLGSEIVLSRTLLRVLP
ncbi:MAG: VWA domain-containing protein [Acidobacteriota bacterium]|nr:MAG: VWA domain-containing protein [Acidobacteriota bacterium]